MHLAELIKELKALDFKVTLVDTEARFRMPTKHTERLMPHMRKWKVAVVLTFLLQQAGNDEIAYRDAFRKAMRFYAATLGWPAVTGVAEVEEDWRLYLEFASDTDLMDVSDALDRIAIARQQEPVQARRVA